MAQWNGDESTALVAATGLITVAVFINVYSLLRFAFFAFGRRVPGEISLDGLPQIQLPYVGAIIALIAAQIFYSFYMRKGKYKEIVKKFSAEDSVNQKRRTTYIYIYAVATVLFYIASLFFSGTLLK